MTYMKRINNHDLPVIGRCLTVIAFCLMEMVALGQKKPLTLWYEKPAKYWEETLPLGNGRLGMMPYGGVEKERVVLNEISLWSGAPQDANNYEAYKELPRIRQLLLEGKNDEAQAIIDRSFVCTGKGSAAPPFGCFQTLGNLDLQFGYGGGPWGAEGAAPRAGVGEPRAAGAGDSVHTEGYVRRLSLDSAIASCVYKVNGVRYTREYITSLANDVDVIRVTADKPGQINCRISINRSERAAVSVDGECLQMTGQLENGTDGKGMRYITLVKVRIKGGSLRPEDGALVIGNATEMTIYLSATTDWRNPAFKEKAGKLLEVAMQKDYEQEKRKHIALYRQLFDRVSFDLGAGTAEGLPTDMRLARFHDHPEDDKGLVALFFQFGRYLSISSTRVGLLPPNLQGLWANDVQTPWNGDYHLDINVQMNQWPVETTNLAELDLPLADLVQRMVIPGERTAKAYYDAPGWIAHVITNIWGFTEPGESASWGIARSGSGWLCSNLWEHYAFTEDTAYLRRIYPILSGADLFYSSTLVTDPKTGWLVTSPSSSPENSFYLPNGKTASICMGPTIDNQILRELFGHVITASLILHKDAALRNTLSARMNKLPPPGRVSPDGRLMEWLEDYKEPEPQHRHIAHLYGLYPAGQITPESTPELAEACKKTLEVRGDDGPSWSIAYKMLWWARLEDGDRAYKLLVTLLHPTLRTDINYGAGGGVYPDLLSAGPPFQIDGNFGATAGIAEMLVQSHAGYVDLLPAIPAAWKSYGVVKGLKARGNLTVDIRWKDGKVTGYKITSPRPRKVKVKVNGIKSTYDIH